MTFKQKVEIGAGVATSLFVLAEFCLFVVLMASREPRNSDLNLFAIVLLLIWFCSLMMAVAACYNSIKQSNVALTFLCIGAIIIIVVLGFCGIFISIFNILIGLLFFAPPVAFSVITIILALSSRQELKPTETDVSLEAANW